MTTTSTTSSTGGSVPARHLTGGDGDLEVLPADAGWTYAGLRLLALGPGEVRTFDTGDEEMVLLPLAGACSVSCDGETLLLDGRRGVFARVSDFAYLPRDATIGVSSVDGGRFALASARCRNRLPFRYGPAEDVPVEIRGAGNCTRQVNNFAAAGVFETDKLIAVEVLTPAGNWSSYPPHKHDEDRPGRESVLEEIYYFEVRTEGSAPHAPPEDQRGHERNAIGYQRVYGTAARPQDLLAEVRSGDVVTIPHGWHGPSMAVPGYDLYYLNVMAGPAEKRAWLICDDPSHAWIRDTWADTAPDPRLPLTGPTETKDG